MSRSGGRLTPTQRYGTKRISPAFGTHSQSDTSLSRRAILSPPTHETVEGDSSNIGNKTLVRYITETLIKKLAKEESLDQVLTLNLTLAKEGGKKIKYIENLEGLKRLQVLNLSCNIIARIEKLDKLTKLKELNLSFNNIERIEGLESLIHLQVLNLSGNQIEHIPAWFGKKLKELRTLRIAKNKLATLQEVARLRPVRDLVQINIADNPLCELPHSRLFIVFQLRTLEILDGKSVDFKERQLAQERFEQEEIENLEGQIEQHEKKFRSMEDEKSKTLTEIKQKGDLLDDLKKKDKDYRKQIKEMQRQMEAKDDLLKKKTSELNKACEKHYRLEQELAFYKIDAKFDSLGQYPTYTQIMEEEDDATEESPYLGRARYKKSSLAGERFVMNKAQPIQVQKLSFDEPDTSGVNLQTRDTVQRALDSQLTDKEENIEKAQDRLHELQGELHNTEHQILQATRELQRIAEATPQRPLTEEDKQQIRNRLAKKMRTVNQLRERAAEIDDEMKHTKQHIAREEKAIQDLQIEMERLGEDHPQYANVKAQVASRKQQLRLANEQYEALQRELDEMLARIEKETAEIKKLEQMLQEGKAAANEELKQELEDIIEGLTEYLKNVKEQATKQRGDYDELRKEKEELMRQLHELEAERSMVRYEAEENKAAKKKLADLEKSFTEVQTENESLRRSAIELSKRPDPETESRLRAAAVELEKLQSTLNEEQRRAQVEREEMCSQLMREQSRVEQALREAEAVGDKEEEARRLALQVAALQATNESLKNRLRDQQEQIDEVMNNSMRPEDVVKRLHEMSVHMDDGADILPYSDRDILGKTLSDLQRQLKERLRQSTKDKEQARKRQEQAEAEIRGMRDRLRKTEEQYKQTTDKALQAKLAEQKKAHEANLQQMHHDMRKLSDKIKEAERRAEEERARQRRELQALQNLPVTPKSPKSPKKTESSSEKNPDQKSTDKTPEKKSTPVKVTTDPKDKEKIKQLERALDDAKKKEKDIDKKASKKVAEAEAQIARLEGELRRRRSRDEEEKKKEKEKEREKVKQHEQEKKKEKERKDREIREIKQKEEGRRKKEHEEREKERQREENQYRNPQARRAARELAKAEEEIRQLQELLEDREKELTDEIEESEKVSETVAAQQDEIDNLYDQLDDQRNEIRRLQEQLSRYGGPQFSDDDPEMNALINEIEELKDALYHQGNRVEDISTPRGPTTRRVHYGDVVDEFQYTPPSSNWPTGRQIPSRTPPPPPTDYYPEDDGRYYTSPRGSPGRYYTRQPDPGYDYPTEPGQMGPPSPPIYAGVPGPAPRPPQPDFNVSGIQYAAAPQPSFAATGPSYATPQPSMVQPNVNMTAANGAVPVAAPASAPASAVFVQAPTTAAATPAVSAVASGVAPPVIITSAAGLTAIDQHPDPLPRQIELPADMLFCNVPEHHDLEDEVAKLHKLLDKQKKGDKRRRRSPGSSDSLVYDRLDEALEEKREELDALDLAVERQRANLRRLKDEDAELKRDKDDTLHELQRLKRAKDKEREELKSSRDNSKKRDLSAAKQSRPVDDVDDDESYTDETVEEVSNSVHASHGGGRRKDEVVTEIHCLENTLSKRRAELREADRLLYECKSDLNEAREKARETISRYDDAVGKLTITQQDAEEIEKRAQDTAEHLVRAEEELGNLKAEAKELEQLKLKREDEIREINRILMTRDADQRSHHTSAGLERLQTDLAMGEDRDSRQKLGYHYGELGDIDHEIGQKKADLQLLLENIEKKKSELTTVLRDGETDMSKKQREIKKVQDALDELTSQRDDLEVAVSEKKSQLIKLRDSTEQEDETLQHLVSNVNKHKTELKHVLEMLQLEKTELEALKQQHSEKMADLEKTQLAVIEEKSELEKLETEAQRKRTELERTKQIVEKERADGERLGVERKSIQENIDTLNKEKELLEGNCSSLENKISHLKRKQTDVEEDIHRSQNKLDKLGQDVVHMEKELEETNNQRTAVQKEVQHVKHQIKEGKNEFKGIKRQLSETQEQKHNLEQEVRQTVKTKSETAAELDRLQGMIDKSKDNLNECQTQERKKQDELHKLLKEIDESQLQLDERKRALQRLHAEIEREEHKQNRLIASLNVELETVNGDIQSKRDELDQTTAKLHNVRRDMDKLQLTKEKYESLEDKVGILSDQVTSLENAVKEREEEKSRLAETLNYTHNEIKILRNDKQECERQIVEVKMELTSAREQLQKSYTDFELERKALTSEIQELEATAQDHCGRANRLSEDLNGIRQEYIQVKKQLRSQADFDEREQRLQSSIKALKLDIRNEVHDGLKDLEMSRMEVLDELEQLHNQKELLNEQLGVVHNNLNTSQLENMVERDIDPQRPHSTPLDDLAWKKDTMRDKLTQEQDELKLKLRQHFSHKADILEDIRKKSESTLKNLKKKLENLEDLVTANTRSYSSMSFGSRLDGVNGVTDSDYWTKSETALKGSIQSPGKSNGSRMGDHYGMNGMEDRSRSWSTSSASELVMPSLHDSPSQDNTIEHLQQDFHGSPPTSPTNKRRGYSAKRPYRSRSAERLAGFSPTYSDFNGKLSGQDFTSVGESSEGKASDQRMRQFMDSVGRLGKNSILEDSETRTSSGEHYSGNGPDH
ncbi:centriolin-like isoform X2 [Glandiceps talaboti]